MKERPILFKGQMVRAILAGTKTVTRRVINPQPPRSKTRECDTSSMSLMENGTWASESDGGELLCAHTCPQGQAGDHLYVREMWRPRVISARTMGAFPTIQFREGFGVLPYGSVPETEAAAELFDGSDEWPLSETGDACEERWRPSIHMPKWASRNVRAERLQDITEEDIAAEGCNENRAAMPDPEGGYMRGTMRDTFMLLWDEINAKRGPEGDPAAYSWARNPWIWRLEFRRIGD